MISTVVSLVGPGFTFCFEPGCFCLKSSLYSICVSVFSEYSSFFLYVGLHCKDLSWICLLKYKKKNHTHSLIFVLVFVLHVFLQISCQCSCNKWSVYLEVCCRRSVKGCWSERLTFRQHKLQICSVVAPLLQILTRDQGLTAR